MTDQIPDDLVYGNDGEMPDDLVFENGGNQPQTKTPDNSIAQWAGVVSKALAPYASAAGAGALAGSVVPGVGTAVGAVAGPAALGLTDLANYGYNLVTGSKNKGLSNRLQDLAVDYGIGREPKTASQRVVERGLEAATDAASIAGGSKMLASMLPKATTARYVADVLGEGQGAQAASAAGSGAAVQAGHEAGINNPAADIALGLAGGLGTGMLAHSTQNLLSKSTVPTTKQVKELANAAYGDVDKAGVVFKPDSVAGFIQNLKNDLSDEGFSDAAATHGPVATQLNKLDKLAGKQLTLGELDQFRSSLSKTLGKNQDADVRRLSAIMGNAIDDYVSNAADFHIPYVSRHHAPFSGVSPDISSGNLDAAREALDKARKLWSQYNKSNDIENSLANARLAEGNVGVALRGQIRPQLNAKKPNKLRGYTPDEVKVLDSLVRKKAVDTALTSTGAALSHGAGFIPALTGNIEGGIGTGVAGLVAGGALNKAAAALMAKRANNAAAYMRGARPVSFDSSKFITPSVLGSVQRAPDGALIIPIPGGSDD